MSYDLMVFQIPQAPVSKNEFMDWYEMQTEWEENHGYNNPLITSPELQAWYYDMIDYFPATIDDNDNPKGAGYTIGRDMIYITFSWDDAEEAYNLTRSLAIKHKVGFFDVSASDGEILRII